MKTDPEFQAAYNAWQADTLATAKAQLVAATGAAVWTVVGSLAKGDAKTAMALLNKLGLLVPPSPGQVEPEKVAHTQRAEREREEMQLFNEEASAVLSRPPSR